MTPQIQIFVTGGTFDKEYNELDGRLFFKNTHVPELLEMGRARLDISIKKLMLIDSLDMKDDDRAVILDEVRKTPSHRIVITHGTDTMVETARALSVLKDKTIVLTGAMIPIKFGSSDGLFNMGSALAFAQTLSSGVYIAMNGRYFPWDAVRKNRDLGLFEEISS
jgi:L-asparaginase